MHPLNLFRFCPKCGSNRFQESSPFSKKCADCGFEYFKNPVIGVAVAAFDTQDRLLCIRRGKEPAKGTLGLPGGF
ncbi:MAG: DNA mismatch repair protein MutT, partial [Alphaproteobacteria bacterium]